MRTSMHYGPPCVGKHVYFCAPYSRLRRSPHVICSVNMVLNYLLDRVGLANHAVANNHDGNTPGQLCATGYLVCSVEMPGI